MDVGAHVYDFFRQRYGPVVAAGIVGNTQQESSNNPNAAGGGLIQGQGGRTSSGSLQQQLHGIDAELNGPERHTLAALRTARTPQQAALIFSQRFERPGEPRNDLRTKYALEAFHRYGSRDVAHATAAGGIANEVMPHIESGPNEAQSADLVQALSQALNQKPFQPAVSAPRRPQSAGGQEQAAEGPKVPQAAQEAPQKDPTAVLSVLAKLAADRSPLPTAQQQPQEAQSIQQQGQAATQGYPLAKVGKVIGLPYQGTHTLFGNWESDNAVDIAAPKGTPVYATEGGTIGSQIGALSTGGDPKLLGLRLHLDTKGNEWYYAHLSKILVKPGQRVQEGQLLGYSGEANGVAHLHIASKNGSPVGLTKKR